jgi:hypothetical protein
MRLNLIFIFLLAVAAALTAIYWKVDRDFFADKLLWNEAQSRSQLSALTRSIESELEAFSQILDLSLPSLQNSKADYATDQAISRFQMVAKIDDQNGDWKLDQKYFLEGTSVKAWAPSYIYLALKTRPPGKDQSNELLTLLDPHRKAWVLLVTTSRTTQNHYVALLPADALQAIVDRQKGQMSTVAILNDQSQVLAHTTSEYIGSLFKEDPMVQEFMKGGNASGSGIYLGLQGEKMHGFYEAVEGSNLFVTIDTPLAVLMAERSKIKIRFLFMGLGISFIGVAMLMLLGDGQTDARSFALTRSALPTPPMSQPLPKQTEIARPTRVAAMVTAPSPPLPPKIPAPPSKAPPAPRKIKSDANERFDKLFSDRKIQEAFAMIDTLDNVPVVTPMPPAPPSVATPAKEERGDTAAVVPVEDKLDKLDKLRTQPPTQLPKAPSMPPPLTIEKIIEKPLEIQMNRKMNKLDHMNVEIRKAGQKNRESADGSAEDLT